LDNRPIGIFDSGMGGLTVRAEIARALPSESLVYFGDGKNVPYGPRPAEEIRKFAGLAVEKLVKEHDAKMIVVACNAATGAAIDWLRGEYVGAEGGVGIPIIGMEPAVKPAAMTTKTGVIGILATAAAFRGRLYKTTAARYRDKIKILETVGEGFVELVENNRENSPEARQIVWKALEPMLVAGADRIVLGCTHYPFLTPLIESLIDEFAEKSRGTSAQIIDSAPAIARRVGQLLDENNLQADRGCRPPEHQFLTFAGENYLKLLDRKAVSIGSAY
jgi:glutamate racemase